MCVCLMFDCDGNACWYIVEFNGENSVLSSP